MRSSGRPSGPDEQECPSPGCSPPWRVAMTASRCAAAAYLAAGLGLVTWSVLPMLAGWTPTVILSGSMEPSLRPGDVVLFDAAGGEAATPGRIVLADDPERPGSLLSHRVRAVNADTSLTTKGDANASTDVAPVPAVVGARAGQAAGPLRRSDRPVGRRAPDRCRRACSLSPSARPCSCSRLPGATGAPPDVRRPARCSRGWRPRGRAPAASPCRAPGQRPR